MPLAWAHAEHLKLLRSLRDDRVFDMPPQPVKRYLIDKTGSPYSVWRFNNKLRTMPQSNILRVEVLMPGVVHWSPDGWQTVYDTPAIDTELGVYVADLPVAASPSGDRVLFTFLWEKTGEWDGADFEVSIE